MFVAFVATAHRGENNNTTTNNNNNKDDDDDDDDNNNNNDDDNDGNDKRTHNSKCKPPPLTQHNRQINVDVYTHAQVKLGKAVKEFARDLVRFGQRHVMRVYPAFFRIDSSNFDPQKAWYAAVSE